MFHRAPKSDRWIWSNRTSTSSRKTKSHRATRSKETWGKKSNFAIESHIWVIQRVSSFTVQRPCLVMSLAPFIYIHLPRAFISFNSYSGQLSSFSSTAAIELILISHSSQSHLPRLRETKVIKLLLGLKIKIIPRCQLRLVCLHWVTCATFYFTRHWNTLATRLTQKLGAEGETLWAEKWPSIDFRLIK